MSSKQPFCTVIPIEGKDEEAKGKFFREEFAKLLRADDAAFAQRDPEDTQIFDYFNRYLREDHCLVNTIVCENSYMCLNYMEDYANYYSRTYTDYHKKCKRLLFFSERFDEATFDEMILESTRHANWESYLGSIVVKPIPRGSIGVTYLKTYDDHSAPPDMGKGKFRERYYKCLTTQTVNLFGTERKITTMPFKEQDGAVASCATAALWMAFQKTSEIFNSPAPSLSEITMLAGGGENGSGRIFPSKGLTTSQVLTAVSKLKMTPMIEEEFFNESYFKAELHAYTKGDIPVLLGLEGIKGEKNTFNHLVVVNGYRYSEGKYEKPSDGTKLLSDTIEVFYVNDDQVGPFARTFIRSDENGAIEIETSWRKRITMQNGKKEFTEDNISVSPGFIIVPLNSSIKVLFRLIWIYYQAVARLFNQLLANCEIIPESANTPESVNFKTVNYDIYIIRSNEYKKTRLGEKEEIFKNWSEREEEEKKRELKAIMSKSFPKYIWVIEARDEHGVLLFDFIYDTVESTHDNVPFMVNIYHDQVNTIIFAENEDKIIHSFSNDYTKFKKSLLKEIISEYRIISKSIVPAGPKSKPEEQDEQKEQKEEEKNTVASFKDSVRSCISKSKRMPSEATEGE